MPSTPGPATPSPWLCAPAHRSSSCRSVLDKAQAVDLATDAEDEEKLKKWLEEINPEDLGKYTM